MDGWVGGWVGRGLIQVGVNVARSKKKKPSESVRAAGRPGPADPVATTFLYTIWQRDHVVFRILYLEFPSHRKTSILPRRSELLPVLT